MDPYSAEGELINIHNHFHQGQYADVVDFDTSALSSENELPARILQLRARIALGQAAEVVSEVRGAAEPELLAVAALAEQAQGNDEKAVTAVKALAASNGENATVQVLGGTVLAAAGNSEEALALLSGHSSNCAYPVTELEFIVEAETLVVDSALRNAETLAMTMSRANIRCPMQWRLLPSSFRSTYNRTETTSRSRRSPRHGDGHRIASWSIWPRHGWE
jgi:predicted Zn-dependent protease